MGSKASRKARRQAGIFDDLYLSIYKDDLNPLQSSSLEVIGRSLKLIKANILISPNKITGAYGFENNLQFEKNDF